MIVISPSKFAAPYTLGYRSCRLLWSSTHYWLDLWSCSLHLVSGKAYTRSSSTCFHEIASCLHLHTLGRWSWHSISPLSYVSFFLVSHLSHPSLILLVAQLSINHHFVHHPVCRLVLVFWVVPSWRYFGAVGTSLSTRSFTNLFCSSWPDSLYKGL